MQHVEPHIIWVIAVSLTISMLVLVFISLIFATVMHNILYRRLDPILFREPWFSSAERALFSSWPLSLVKAGHYMFLIAYPKRSRRKRFINLEQELPIDKHLRMASRIYLYTHFLTAITGVSWLLFVFGVYAVDNWLN